VTPLHEAALQLALEECTTAAKDLLHKYIATLLRSGLSRDETVRMAGAFVDNVVMPRTETVLIRVCDIVDLAQSQAASSSVN
jgi:hypothetical protein